MEQDEAEKLLAPHFDQLWDCAVAGFNQWKRYPNRPKHLKRTRANIVHDLMMDAAVKQFDNLPQTRIVELRSQNERFLIINEQIALWFKKLDRSLKSSNFPTWQALRRKSGQLKLFGDLTILIIGYVLNPEESKVERVSITLPNGRKRPIWFIDLHEPERGIRVIPNNTPDDGNTQPIQKVRIKRGEQQKKIEYE